MRSNTTDQVLDVEGWCKVMMVSQMAQCTESSSLVSMRIESYRRCPAETEKLKVELAEMRVKIATLKQRPGATPPGGDFFHERLGLMGGLGRMAAGGRQTCHGTVQ